MVKITYDLNNVKDVEMVENYYWLKYQFKCLEFDVFGNAKINKYLKNYLLDMDSGYMDALIQLGINKTKEEIRDMILTFYNERDLIRIADIFKDVLCYESDCYIELLSAIYYHGTDFYMRLYKYVLIEKFGNK